MEANIDSVDKGMEKDIIEMYPSPTGYAYLFLDGDLVKVLHIDDAREVRHWDMTVMYMWEYEGKNYYMPSHEFKDKTQ